MKCKYIMLWKIFIIFVIFGMYVHGIEAYASEELYFNDNGDLVFATYDKKATSGTKYRTIGWVLKRYDDVITAPAQSSIHVGNSNLFYEMEDPYDSAYVYTCFIIDGQNILNRIGALSADWKKQLVQYGGAIYMDAVMTIVSNGVAQGSITANGQMSGEVYDTYLGIRNARGWADGDKLRAYYGIKVNYPYVPVKGSFSMKDTKVTTGKEVSMIHSSFVVDGGTKENNTYQVQQGIPAGEKIYIYGMVDAFRYEAAYQTVNGSMKIPVGVYTDYKLCWTDSSGVARSEIQKVQRWYMVERPYQYIRVNSVNIYGLNSVVIDGQCYGDVTSKVNAEIPSYQLTHKNDSKDHVTLIQSATYQAGTVVVNSKNCQKPSIPDVNQKALAEKAVGAAVVWNDTLKINGTTVLAGTKCEAKGSGWTAYKNLPQKTIYLKNVEIFTDTKNASGYSTTAKLNYVNRSSDVYYAIDKRIHGIVVHTPVIADMCGNGERTQNENLFPKTIDFVAGEGGTVALTAVGQHRNILGYKKRNYLRYVENIFVKFPFEVNYQNRRYKKDEWIEVNQNIVYVQIPENTVEGVYQGECLVAASNTPANCLDISVLKSLAGEGANLRLAQYGAYNTFEINVIGKVYGFHLVNRDSYYVAGEKIKFPEIISQEEELLPVIRTKKDTKEDTYQLGVYANALGDTDDEYVDIELSYFCIEKDAKGNYVRKELDVYSAVDDRFTAATLMDVNTVFRIGTEQSRCVREGVYYFWNVLDIPKYLVAVPKGSDIGEINIKSDDIVRDGIIIVHVEIYGADKNGRKLSYKNEENAKNGYCNMWMYEGFCVDKETEIPLECGDIIILDMDGTMKNSGIVVGTH